MRKSQADPMKLIVLAVILLIVMIILIVIFRNVLTKEANVTIGTIDKVSTDTDDDGSLDIIDFCPYNSEYARKEETPNGKKSDCKPCIDMDSKC